MSHKSFLRKIYFIQLSKEQQINSYTIRRATFLSGEIAKYIKEERVSFFRIIDLGSGNGLVERQLSMMKNHIIEKRFSIICVDLNIEFLTSKWIGEESEKIQAFLPWIPLRQGSANVIILSEVLEHLPVEFTVPLLKKLYEMLVNDGLLIITTPNVFNYVSRVRAILTGKLDLMNDPQHFQCFKFNMLKQILEQIGFKVERIHFDIVMHSNGILSKFAIRIPYRMRKMLLSLLPDLDKLIIIKAYKRDHSI